MADCFYVADRIYVQPLVRRGNADDRPAVSVTMEFGLNFLKSTMFKGIITKKTTSEYVQLFEALAEYMSDALSGEEMGDVSVNARVGTGEEVEVELENCQNPTPAEPKPRAQPDAPRPSATLSWMDRVWSYVTVERVLLAGVILLQGWILYELRSLAKSVRLMESIGNAVRENDGIPFPTCHLKDE